MTIFRFNPRIGNTHYHAWTMHQVYGGDSNATVHYLGTGPMIGSNALDWTFKSWEILKGEWVGNFLFKHPVYEESPVEYWLSVYSGHTPKVVVHLANGSGLPEIDTYFIKESGTPYNGKPKYSTTNGEFKLWYYSSTDTWYITETIGVIGVNYFSCQNNTYTNYSTLQFPTAPLMGAGIYSGKIVTFTLSYRGANHLINLPNGGMDAYLFVGYGFDDSLHKSYVKWTTTVTGLMTDTMIVDGAYGLYTTTDNSLVLNGNIDPPAAPPARFADTSTDKIISLPENIGPDNASSITLWTLYYWVGTMVYLGPKITLTITAIDKITGTYEFELTLQGTSDDGDIFGIIRCHLSNFRNGDGIPFV